MGQNETSSSGKGLYARVRRSSALILDNVASREAQQQFFTNVANFANEQPYLASFVLIQLILSFTPVAFFSSFVAATVLLSSVTALLFALFWIGAALLVLVPILFITISLGIVVWMWATGSFLLAKWTYNVIPVSLRGGMEVDMPNGKKMVVNKSEEGYGDVDVKVKNETD